MNIQILLSKKVRQAMIKAGIPNSYDPKVRRSSKIKYGNYQVNGIINAAKKLKRSPQDLAANVLSFLDLKKIAKKIEIVNPGFINIFLDLKWVEKRLKEILTLPSFGIKSDNPQTIVIDYSSPNMAKEMHTGHLRSTIIGDATARTLEVLGHKVVRINHLGDWGMQFGMLIAYLTKYKNDSNINISLSNLELFYRKAKLDYQNDPDFAKLARKYLVKLQSGDKYCKNIWKKLVDITTKQNQKIYNRLNVKLTHENSIGESTYNNMLPNIVADLKKKGIAKKNQGAIVVFLNEFHNKSGEPMGVIIQKRDGGYLYSTTDIACAKYRYETLHPDRMIYYIDSRQHQHLMQVWSIVRKAGYVPKHVTLEHHSFGMMQGKNGRPFKTSSGVTIKLSTLLNEAYNRALEVIRKKNPKIEKSKLQKLAEIIGISAVKYADLSKNRESDYIFNWDNILTFEGNTAPYMQYAYARILSIFRKSGVEKKTLNSPIIICENCELQLAIHILQFEEIITQVGCYGTPHLMCAYLYDLATLFSIFYEKCPILYVKNKMIHLSRLQLAKATAKTLKQGLYTLGIKTVNYM